MYVPEGLLETFRFFLINPIDFFLNIVYNTECDENLTNFHPLQFHIVKDVTRKEENT